MLRIQLENPASRTISVVVQRDPHADAFCQACSELDLDAPAWEYDTVTGVYTAGARTLSFHYIDNATAMEVAYREANWKQFGEIFAIEYADGDNWAKLKLLRALLCEYRDKNAQEVCLKVL